VKLKFAWEKEGSKEVMEVNKTSPKQARTYDVDFEFVDCGRSLNLPPNY
jgi:hypothetical protein